MKKILFVCVCALLSGSPLLAALNEVPGGGGFGADSVLFDFSGPAAGSRAARALAKWGITFEEGEAGIPVIDQEVVLGFVNNSVLNVPLSGNSANRPLILNFAYPASRIGFRLSNGSEATVVTIQAYGPNGADLGTVTRNGLAEPVNLAVVTDSASGIAKLVFSYGADQAPEQLDELQVAFVARPSFEIYLAQVGDGPIPGVGALQTTIVATNLSGSTTQGEIQFYSSSGDPLVVSNGQSSGSSFPLNIARGGSFSFTTDGQSDPVGVGYARLVTNVPVEATAIFGIVSNAGGVITEAGVGSAEGRSTMVGAVLKRVEGNLDSGIALVNTSDEVANAVVELFDTQGRFVATSSAFAGLGAGEHSAAFLSGIFPTVANSDFRGTVRITSNVPMAAVILRTGNGLVLSSLPVGSLE
jgi:hypothetical protein